MAAAPDDEGGHAKLTQGESDHGEIHASEQCTVGNIAYQLRRKTLHDSPRIRGIVRTETQMYEHRTHKHEIVPAHTGIDEKTHSCT